MNHPSSKLLIDESPLQVLPSLACAVGLNEAIFIQQIHYWLRTRRAVEKGGRRWIRMPLEEWHEQFPFWGLTTLRRTIRRAEDLGIVLSGGSGRGGDRTKMYSLEYGKLEEIWDEIGGKEESKQADETLNLNLNQLSEPTGQLSKVDTSTVQNEQLELSKVDTSIYMETSKETIGDKDAAAAAGWQDTSTVNPEPVSPGESPSSDEPAWSSGMQGAAEILAEVRGFPGDNLRQLIGALCVQYPDADVREVATEYRDYHRGASAGDFTRNHPRRLRAFFRRAQDRAEEKLQSGANPNGANPDVTAGYEWLFGREAR